ncbi:MAG: S41 family peptidase [Anaerolineae bacterium]|nr:S41 family peptidase [Anaerolineae bacterium]
MKPGLTTKQRWLDAIARGVLTGAALSVAFLIGFVVRGHFQVTAQEHDNSQFPLLQEVGGLLEAHYLRELPPERELEYAAIRGYLGALSDPYTFFIDPPVTQNESEVLAGQYGGIGVQVRHNEQGLFVLYPFRDGPAAAAGIRDGDILLTIDDQSLNPAERPDVVDRMLRGEVGDGRGVTIAVQTPDDSSEPREYFIEFQVVMVPSVVWRPLDEDPSLGYIQIIRFTSRTPDELRTALDDLNETGVTALVLDMRGNAGGLLQESVEVASEFLDGVVVFYEKQRSGETETVATTGGTGLDKPLVVLVDQGTASAAELVAGAIRDQGRGILIGQQTYGKGSVQLIFRLSDDSSIHITSAEWYTPARTVLDGNGLTPDISMIPAEDGRDVELGEAIRYLHQITD